MLERVIQHHDVGAVFFRLADRGAAVRIYHDGNVGIQASVHLCFVIAVTAKRDRRARSHFELEREPRRKRRLPGASNSEVANADRGEIWSRGVEDSAVVQPGSNQHRRVVDSCDRPERRSHQNASCSTAIPDVFDRRDPATQAPQGSLHVLHARYAASRDASQCPLPVRCGRARCRSPASRHVEYPHLYESDHRTRWSHARMAWES